jgi:hypothetical protein
VPWRVGRVEHDCQITLTLASVASTRNAHRLPSPPPRGQARARG